MVSYKRVRVCACRPVLGDVMGPTLNNLDKLLRLPFGCGEQNMIHFAPNVFVLKYLQKTQQLSTDVETEATDYLLQGKQSASTVYLSAYECFIVLQVHMQSFRTQGGGISVRQGTGED